MKARRIVAVFLAIAAVAGAVAFGLWSRQQAAAKASEAPAQAAAQAELSFDAVLQAASTVPIAVPVDGKVEAFEVEAGAEVYEGQLLARIRSEALETTQQAAAIDLEAAETRVRNLEGTISAARLEASRASADAARVRNDMDRASKYYQRQKMLLEQGATPRNTFEKAEKEFAALEAESKNLDAVATGAEERIGALQRELDTARKILEGKAADLEEAKEQIGSGDVLSPVNGVVVARRGQAGDDVHVSMTDLFQIATDLSRMLAVAEASAENMKRVQPGQEATVTIAEMGGETLQGTVSKVEDGKITVEFANANPLIKPGLTAQIRIKLT